MADDRPLETTEEAVGRLDGKLADLESTLLARLSRLPTGTMLPTPASTAPPNTLLCQGQTVTRAAYPALWKWATDHGAVVAGLFGAGDGTTTFTLPDARNRTLVGAGGTYVLGATGGADTRAIAIANLPAHDHNVSVATHGQHDHTGGTTLNGSHGGTANGHCSGAVEIQAGSGNFVAADTQVFAGEHTHGLNIDTASAGPHSVTESSIGSGTAFDVRQPYLATNYLVYV